MTKTIHHRNRSAMTGKFVSASEAKANPETTVTETARENAAEKFLQLLIKGGRIVSSNDLTVFQISDARSENRLYVDDHGFGFVYLPAE